MTLLSKFLKNIFYLIFLAPFGYMLSMHTSMDLNMWVHLANNVFVYQLFQSLLLGSSAMVSALLISVPLAYIAATKKFIGINSFLFVVVFPLVMPTYIAGIIYIDLLFNLLPNWFPNWLFAGFIFGFFHYPYVFLPLYVGLKKTSTSYIELHRQQNTTLFFHIWKILLPMYSNAVVVGLLMVFLETLGDYGTVSLFGLQTMTVGVYQLWFGAEQIDTAIQYGSIILLLGSMIWFLHQNSSVRNFHKIDENTYMEKTHIFNWLYFLPVFIVTLIIPLCVLLYWIVGYPYIVDFNVLQNTLYTTVSIGILSATLTTILAYSLIKSNMWGKIYTYGYAVPPIILALAILYFLPVSITNTYFILLLPFVIRFLGFPGNSIYEVYTRNNHLNTMSLYRLKPGLMIKNEYLMYRKALLTGWLLVFIDTIKEVNISLFLQPFNYQSVSLQIYNAAKTEQPELAAVWCIILLFILIPVSIILSRIK
jgi:iron(III) transport system permease protein